MFRPVVTVLTVLLAAAGAAAQGGGITDAPAKASVAPQRQAGDEVRLVVTNPPASMRALEYRLAFRPTEQIEGNASSQWLQACVLHGKDSARTELVSDWLGAKDEAFDQDAAWAAISGFVHDVYPVALVAARKEQCDWGSPIRSEGIATLLPELASLRDIARSIALKARIELWNKDFEAAAETLSVGLALTSDLGNSPTLIQGLVGIAVGSHMCEQLEQWVRTANAPSLYWPLSHLDTPLVSMSRAYSFESSMLDFTFPDLARLKSGAISPQEAARLSADVLTNLGSMNTGEESSSGTLASFAAAASAYPSARAYLIGQGMSAAEVEALPVSFVTLRWQIESYQRYADEVFKWTSLPFFEVEPVMERVWPAMAEEMQRAQSQQPMLMVLPAINNSFVSSVVFERRFALLRVMEALRLYAAEHNAFPGSLAQITTLPVPNDPVTGQPFEYRLDGEVAVISGRAPKLGMNRKGIERQLVRFVPIKPAASPSKE